MTSLLDMSVRELLDAVSSRTSAPGGGAVAAVTTALAAALTGMVARYADAEGAAADALRDRAAALADADAAAYGAFLTAVRRPRDGPGRDAAVAAARDGAAAVPGEIAAIAEAVSALAAPLVDGGNPNLRGDAVAAVLLAAAAAQTAAELVAVNVGADPRTEQARAHAIAAEGRVTALSTPGVG